MKNNLLTRFSSPWRFVWEQNELEMAGYKCQNLQHHRPWVTVARGKYIQSSSWLECTRVLLFGSSVYWAYIICQSTVLKEKSAKECEQGWVFSWQLLPTMCLKAGRKGRIKWNCNPFSCNWHTSDISFCVENFQVSTQLDSKSWSNIWLRCYLCMDSGNSLTKKGA